MRIGISSAQLGRLADPAAVRATALAAERIGYSTLWVVDRLPVPLAPRTGYGGIDGLAIPPEQDRALDPFAVLAAVAGITSRIRIGTSVLVAPWYPPAILARLLTSIDVLSEGRLTAGLGTGWSVDEDEAVDVAMRRRGRHLDEILDVLDAHWSDGPIAHHGDLARIAPAKNLLRPVQRPRPPVLLAAHAPAALERVARRADGWMPIGYALDLVPPAWAHVRDLAAGFGRDPDALRLVVRADLALEERPVDGARLSFHGSLEQLCEDVEATDALGADEIILHVGGDPSLDEMLEVCASITEQVGTQPAYAPPD